MKEVDLQRLLAAKYSEFGRLWVNDNGLGYHKVGNQYIGFMHGLGKGTSDLIGFTDTIITDSMVGSTLPVFTAFEVKTKTGRASEEQKNFIKMVKDHNGICGIVKSWEDVEEIKKA